MIQDTPARARCLAPMLSGRPSLLTDITLPCLVAQGILSGLLPQGEAAGGERAPLVKSESGEFALAAGSSFERAGPQKGWTNDEHSGGQKDEQIGRRKSEQNGGRGGGRSSAAADPAAPPGAPLTRK